VKNNFPTPLEETMKEKNKIIVFSAIFGDYDDIKEPLYEHRGVDFILFTDNLKIKSKRWQIIVINRQDINGDPQRAARFIKVNPHIFLPETHDISVWVDGNYRIIARNITEIIKGYSQYDLITYKHPKRGGLYEEISRCAELMLDDNELLKAQKEKYLSDSFPRAYGLFHTAVLIRKNIPRVNNMNDAWWLQIAKFSKRDQISLPYVLYNSQVKVGLINEVNLYHSKYFKKSAHKRERTRYE
jgi:hypothetical protein